MQTRTRHRPLAVLCLAVVTLIGAGLVHAAGIANAATTYSLVSLDATVSGTSVVARATVRASTAVTAQNAGICVRDSGGANRDFPSATNVVISSSGTVLTSPAKVFAAGSYRYFACLKVAGSWTNVGTSKNFVVGAAPPPVGSALTHWTAALNNRANAPANWLAIGDSITEGQGAPSRDNRWITRTLAGLRAAYPTAGVVGGAGYLPGWYAVYGPDSPWTPYSARSGSISNASFGSLGMRTATLRTGASQTYTVTGTSTDIYYTTNGGTFSYAVDGGAAASVNTAGPYRTDNRVRVGFGGAGIHSLRITAVSGTVYLSGVTVFNGDENKGITVFDHAHSGFSSVNFATSRTELNPLIKLIGPDLVTIALGANDYLHGAASPAQLRTNLQNEIANLRKLLADQPPSIVIVLHYALPPPGAIAGWAQYADAIRSVVAADPTVGLLDMSSMGTAAPGGYFSADAIHPSTAGHAEMARRAIDYLEPS